MDDTKLTPSSYLVLGLIGLRGPSSSYELKRAAGRSIGYFWPFPHSQLYVEPRRLATAGLLEESSETGGRRRRTYSLTERGRQALRAWLRDPKAEVFQVRDEAELKLFFSELGDEGTVENLAREQVKLHQERLEKFQKMLGRLAEVPELEQRVAPLALGVSVEMACLRFWRGVLEDGIRGAMERAGAGLEELNASGRPARGRA